MSQLGSIVMDVQSFIQRFLLIAVVFLFSLLIGVTPAEASIQLNAQFTATQSCEALQSIRRGTNPGNIRLTPGTVYPVVAKNKEDATHYHLRIDGVDPPLRWVAIDCGELLGAPAPTESISPKDGVTLLAISWQPAFCETRENKTECQTQTADRFDATHFTLHGLWPQPTYCNVSDRIKKLDHDDKWEELPDIELSEPLINDLKVKMPGFASKLHLHEWYKHGTCYSATPEEYFSESLALLGQVNDSSVREFFVENIDRRINSQDIRDEFSDAFGNGAGSKVSVKCARDPGPVNRRMIQELRLNFQGEIDLDTPVAQLLEKGKVVSVDCPDGEVDRAGFN